MKKTFMTILLALFCICGYAQTIDPVLMEVMGQRRSDDKIKVFVIMRQQYDQQQLNRRAAHFTTRADRRGFVVNELKQFAEASQYDLRHSLVEMQRNDLVSEPKTLWIANAIFFEATRDAILSLADRSDIMVIGFDEERNWLPDGEESQPADPTREITSNVTQVNANQVWNLGYTGQGVVVAVIDTGVNYNHLDLADHLWDGGTEFPHHGYDIYNNDNDPMDDHSHGTHCAGTVCGDGSAGSQTGMAPDATLMCVKCLGANGRGSDTDVINGMQWAVDHGCDVISMSLGGHGHSGASQTISRNACVNVLSAGVIASISAGNEGDQLSQYPIPDNIGLPGGCPPPYLDPEQEQNPGGLSCSVCVGAVDSNDQAAYFTSQGPRDWSNSDYADYPYTSGSLTEFGLIRPDVCAPGVYIKSADYSSNTGYSTKSGTSMAAPCVAGCMALMLSKNIDATPAELCRILEETAVPLSTGKSNIYGYGRIDVLAAINAMQSGPLTLNAYTVNDGQGNNDGKLNAGESVTLNLTLTNDSNIALDGATMALTTESEEVTITNGTANLPHFGAGQTRTINNMFSFTLSDDAEAKRMVYFRAETFINGESQGAFRISVMVYGHILRFVEVAVLNDNNGNGLLDAGETANLHVTVCNVGNDLATSVVGTLSTTYPYLVINSNNKSFGTIDVNGQASADFNVSLSGNAPESYTLDLSLDLVDAYQKHTDVDFELWKKAITLSSNPSEGGTLSGGGYYGQGQTCTITATANPGYAFVKWTLNGSTVSFLSSYTFEVAGEASYVAHFQAVTHGVVIGDGAETEDHLPSYSLYCYTLSQQIYTAEEMNLDACDIFSVSFFNAGYSKTRNYDIYMVNTDKVAFNSSSDLIPVTEENRVFSGNVSMSNGVWTTIYFSTPFTYDGTSNVALIVDDNTGTWYYNNMSCRVFSTENNQAFYVNSDNINYDPINSTSYSGYRLSVKNQIIFGLPYYITATANPTDYGSVSGSGAYAQGATCTLTATPNFGYFFLNWTEDGSVVSYDATYSFTVNGDRNLVANFVEGGSLCNIVFDLHDSYGDGWNGNYLVVDYGDGHSEQFTIESGSSASYTRAVETGSNIALTWIAGSYIGECSFDIKFENGVLIYHKTGLNSSFQQELNIDCSVATAPRVITAVANPEEGGTIEGTGTYESGTTITLTAIPNEGYAFCFWSENGQQVSTDANYSFLVSSDRNLIARFSLPMNISVATNITEGGLATGGGVYYFGNTCTLTATPNEGYLFLHWSKNGEVVSCNASYSFSVTEDAEIEAVFMLLEGTLIGQGESTNSYLPSYSYWNYTMSQQIYTPNEIGGAGNITSISYYNGGTTKTRTYDIYMVHTDKMAFSGNTDWIAVTEADRVYSGSVNMDKGYWNTIVLDTPFAYDGTSNLAVIVDDNTGSWSSGMACRVFNAQGSQAIYIYSDNTNYDPYNPSSYSGTRYSSKNQMILGFMSSTAQTIELSAGWNWFSTYIELDDPVELLEMLQEALGENGVQIESVVDGVNMNIGDGYWAGDLDGTGLLNEHMYMIEVSEVITVELQGPATNPEVHPITIYPNDWSWIGYPCAEEVDVNIALADFEAEEGDMIETLYGEEGGVIYYYGGEWVGDFDTMIPGQGYMYYSNSSIQKTLIFSTTARGKSVFLRKEKE